MSRMLWVAGGLAAGLAALFLVLWFAPEDEETTPAKTGAAKAVKVDAALAEQGKQVSEANGCGSCHSTDGSKGVGPSWQAIYGTMAELGSGESVEVDDKYLSAAILDPGAQVREGYGASMPSYQGKLSDEEVEAIIEYIKGL